MKNYMYVMEGCCDGGRCSGNSPWGLSGVVGRRKHEEDAEPRISCVVKLVRARENFVTSLHCTSV
jgi:hypothetical protein